MRVIYNTCFADPWLKVAKKLKDEHGFEPVYWNGYEDDNSKKLVSESFPNCIYQDYYHGWKGVFSKEIKENYAESYIDIDFLREFASYELQAIKMMDRMDPDRYSFNFMERQRHFRNLIKYWTACINVIKPDLIISAVVPHRVFDYVLYLLCKHYGIEYLSYRNFNFNGIIIPIKNIISLDGLIKKDYKTFVDNGLNENQYKDFIHETVLLEYNKVRGDYKIAEPDYMKKNVQMSKRSNSFLSLLIKFFSDSKSSSYRYFGSQGVIINGFPTYYKVKSKSIEKSNVSLFRYSILKLSTNRYKKRLNNYYNSKVEDVDFKNKYILLPLHYQPEMTSNPSGDIFVDQLLCVEMLLKNTPSDYYIYVKEHRSQFYSHAEGHTSRIVEFYDDLCKYSRVKLISTDYNQFELIEHSVAVATITGTSGWEAMVRQKPVILFGLSWYEEYQGVLKITDEKSGKNILNFIQEFRFDEINLLAYLASFSKNSVKAYFYRGLKGRMNMSEDECVGNLVKSVLELSGGRGDSFSR